MSDAFFHNELPLTRASLLSGLRHQSQEQRLIALGVFYERYRQGLAKLLVKRYRIEQQDADEILHDFLMEKMVDAKLIESYLDCIRSPQGGHRIFRPYLVRSLCNFTIDQLRKRRIIVAGDAAVEASLDDECADLYTLQWAQEVLNTTFHSLRCHYLDRENERYWSLFVSRWIEPLITGQSPPAYEQLAIEHGFENAKQVGNALTNVLRMFKQKWREALHEDLGTRDELAVTEAIQDAKMSVKVARYIDFSQVLTQVMRGHRTSSQAKAPESYSNQESTYQGFLNLASDGFDQLLPIEQALMFESYMRTPIGTCIDAQNSMEEETELGEKSFAFVLADPAPDPKKLRLLAKCLRDSIRCESVLIPTSIAGVIRFALIALAEIRCQQKITSISNEELTIAMEGVVDQAWLDTSCRTLIQDFLNQQTASHSDSSCGSAE